MTQEINSDSVGECTVARPVVNIFREATTESEVISQAIYGAIVFAQATHPGWCLIRTADSLDGWAESAGFHQFDSAPYAPKGARAVVNSNHANVYREPDITIRPPLLQMPWEAVLEIAGDDSVAPATWQNVRLVDGLSAWVHKGDLVPHLPMLSVAEVLQFSRRFLGITYTWGGVSSFGFDCSGLTQMLMRQRGILMPRNASEQAAWSNLAVVECENIEPGDLLFFISSGARINHTGMYLGDREFIHSTAQGRPGVQIGNLGQSPWATTLVAARRLK